MPTSMPRSSSNMPLRCARRRIVRGHIERLNPLLLYVYAEPEFWPGTKRRIGEEERARHREEIDRFADLVEGDEVAFTIVLLPNPARRMAERSGCGDSAPCKSRDGTFLTLIDRICHSCIQVTQTWLSRMSTSRSRISWNSSRILSN